ncbi:hypothetical protein Anapl_18010 [Anas platyrhynchos]|uniref:Uncharacterized protein n=1 Tax=Anas platyrhynchos TaxID=8839 RepID=R0KB18_ANAPL|nr:hypothetical protein Anapl_18010 [Anas platyrhynchos]
MRSTLEEIQHPLDLYQSLKRKITASSTARAERTTQLNSDSHLHPGTRKLFLKPYKMVCRESTGKSVQRDLQKGPGKELKPRIQPGLSSCTHSTTQNPQIVVVLRQSFISPSAYFSVTFMATDSDWLAKNIMVI